MNHSLVRRRVGVIALSSLLLSGVVTLPGVQSPMMPQAFAAGTCVGEAIESTLTSPNIYAKADSSGYVFIHNDGFGEDYSTNQYGSYGIHSATVKVPDNAVAGDTFTFTMSNGGWSGNFPSPVAADGSVIANPSFSYIYNEEGKRSGQVLTFTYTDYVESHDNVEFSFSYNTAGHSIQYDFGYPEVGVPGLLDACNGVDVATSVRSDQKANSPRLTVTIYSDDISQTTLRSTSSPSSTNGNIITLSITQDDKALAFPNDPSKFNVAYADWTEHYAGDIEDNVISDWMGRISAQTIGTLVTDTPDAVGEYNFEVSPDGSTLTVKMYVNANQGVVIGTKGRYLVETGNTDYLANRKISFSQTEQGVTSVAPATYTAIRNLYTPDAGGAGADLATPTITKTWSDTEKAWTITVTNPSTTAKSRAVSVTDNLFLQEGSSVSDISDLPITEQTAGIVNQNVWVVPSLDSGASVTAKVVPTADLLVGTGTLINRAGVTGDPCLADTTTPNCQTSPFTQKMVPPVAVADGKVIPSDQWGKPATINVIGNDVPGSGSKLKVSVPSTSKGWTANDDGTLTYDPAVGGKLRKVETPYTITNEYGQTASATATFSFTPVAPGATNDTLTVTPDKWGKPATISVIPNDTPGSSAFKQVKIPANATGWTVNPDNTLSYDPAVGGKVLKATVEYSVFDEFLYSADATATINYTPAPPVTKDDSVTVQPEKWGTATKVDILSNDTPGSGKITKVTIPNDANGWTVNDDNTLSYDPSVGGKVKSAKVNYTITDEFGLTATATATVNYTPVAPAASDDNFTLATDMWGKTATIKALANDKPGSGKVTKVTVPSESKGWTVNPDNTLSYDPAVGGKVLKASTQYTYTDEFGLTATATATVNYTPVLPFAIGNSDNSEWGLPVTVNVLDNDIPGSGKITKVSIPEDAKGWTVNEDNSVTYDPSVGGEVLEAETTYTITDEYGKTASSKVTIVYDPTAPVAADDIANTTCGSPVTIDLTDNDTLGTGKTLQVSIPEDAASNWSLGDDGSLVYTTTDGSCEVRDSSIEYTITDEYGKTSTATATVSVSPVLVVPDAPEVADAECGVSPEVSLPEVEGIEYTTEEKDGKTTVTATAVVGFAIPEDVESEWSLDTSVEPCPTPAEEVVNKTEDLARTGAGASLLIPVAGALAAFAGIGGTLSRFRRRED